MGRRGFAPSTPTRPSTESTGPFLELTEAAAYTGIDAEELLRLGRAEKIRYEMLTVGTRVPRRFFFRSDLDAYLAGR